MTVEELRLELIKIIKKNPISLRQLAREMGLKNSVTLSDFIFGRRIPYFQNLTHIENWVEKQKAK